MKIEVLRFNDNGESTISLLKVNSKFFCYTLEDEYREVKVKNHTRIPKGEYNVTLRDVGGMTGRYKAKYPGIHKGMLWVRDVPNFQYIYIHAGNTDDHTSGCLLVGNALNNNRLKDGFVGESAKAYVELYKLVIAAMDREEEVTIEYKNI